MTHEYDAAYYATIRAAALRSARVIVPIIVEWVRPRSVVDVGCGVGTWLSVFQEHGVDEVCGIDGAYVDPEQLDIAPSAFRAQDLEEPFEIDRTYDLVVSLEVAEHLAPDAADGFVERLTALGPVVLFSAAVPHQGGEHHVNEQWPAYWVERFAAQGYRPVDVLRARIWDQDDVSWWYAQNALLYARPAALEERPELARLAGASPAAPPPALVHPANYLRHVWKERAVEVFRAVERCAPLDAPVILVDEEKLRFESVMDRAYLPFPERHGRYAGLPPDDETAIAELERLRERGAAFLALAWPAFWWSDHYEWFDRHVTKNFRRVHSDQNVRLFDLKSGV